MELVCCTSICHFRFGSMLNELIFALMPFLTIVEADTGRRKIKRKGREAPDSEGGEWR